MKEKLNKSTNDQKIPSVDLSQSNQIPILSIIPIISSRTILQGNKEIGIEHRGQIYFLRITGKDKLLLKK